jgi:hypothetical protein
MCRSIRTLRAAEPHPTTGDVQAAARQYVRKLSGYRTPSRANAAVFDAAIAEVAAATERMLAALGTEPVDGPEQPPVRRPA